MQMSLDQITQFRIFEKGIHLYAFITSMLVVISLCNAIKYVKLIHVKRNKCKCYYINNTISYCFGGKRNLFVCITNQYYIFVSFCNPIKCKCKTQIKHSIEDYNFVMDVLLSFWYHLNIRENDAIDDQHSGVKYRNCIRCCRTKFMNTVIVT